MQDLLVVQVYIHVTVIFINTVIVGNFNGFKILKIYQNKSVNRINFVIFLQTTKFNSHKFCLSLPLPLSQGYLLMPQNMTMLLFSVFQN